MRLLTLLLAPLLLTATVLVLPAASAREDPCEKLGGQCPEPFVTANTERACVGVRDAMGGWAYCWFRERPHCVTRYFWTSYHEVCLPADGLATFDCDVCPWPILVVEEGWVCAGVNDDSGGTGVCAREARCAILVFAGYPVETCVPELDGTIAEA